MSINIQQVSKLYGTQKALNGISFTLNTGEVLGFLGPNGAGKSTLMKIITGYLPPSSGTVEVNGLNVQEHSLEVRRQIGYLPEHNPLYLDMYVKEYLGHVADIYQLKNKKQAVERMLELTGLTPEYRKQIGSLSKGYRQRVGLAQALIHDPQVLILDEPTSGLDPNQIIEIRNLITEVAKEKTIMLSTHIMQEVKAICDRVIIIKKGELVADDRPEHIEMNQPRQLIAVEFNTDPTVEQLEAIAGVQQAEKEKAHHWLLYAEADQDIRQAVFEFAVQNQLSVLSMQEKKSSLEQAFQELTSNKK